MNMNYKNIFLKVVVFLCFVSISFGQDYKDIFISIGTGPIDGVFYPAGTAISEIIKKVGYNSSACSTAGSGENIDLIIDKKIEMAIAMSDTVYQAYYGVGAYKGKGPIKNLNCITGSGENIDLIIDKKIEMAIAMSDTVYQAYYGVGAYKGKGPIKNLNCITGLHPNYTQIVTLRDSNIKTFKDLKGKRIGIGIYNSGVELNARLLYEAHNMKYSDSEIIYGTPGELIEQLKNHILDAIFLTNTVPTDIIYNLSLEMPINFVAIEDEGIEKLREKWPFFFKEKITKEDYNIEKDVQTVAVQNLLLINFVAIEDEGIEKLREKWPFFFKEKITKEDYNIEKDVQTVAVQNLLLVDRNLPEGIVYDITKAFFENIEEVRCSNLGIRRNVSLENYNKNVGIPFHKGALKYYKDKGII